MGLSILTGQCWRQLAKRFDSFEAVPMEHIIQIGVRDTDTEEESRLEQSEITRLRPNDLSRLREVIADLSRHVRKVYVHVDVDVLDVSQGAGNSYACEGGLSLEDLFGALEVIARAISIEAGSVTSYDPESDRDCRIGRAIPRIVELLAR